MGTPNFSTLADDICSRIIGPCEYFVFERTIWVNPTEDDILQPNLPWNDAVLEAAGFVQVCGAGGGGGGGDPDQNLFETIQVAGQLDVVADNTTDILTLVAGTDITITTDSATDTITFNAVGAAADTNFANDNLTQDANRTHDLAGFIQNWDDLGTFDLQINTLYTSLVGTAPNLSKIEQTTTNTLSEFAFTGGVNRVSQDNNSILLDFEGNSDLKIDSDPGLLDQYLASQGPDTPPTWKALPITAGCPGTVGTTAAIMALRTGGSLQTGCWYEITDHSQGYMTGVTIRLRAVGTNKFAMACDIVPDAAWDADNVWSGMYNVTTNLLTRVEDNLGNTITDEDGTCIAEFPWGASGWVNNRMHGVLIDVEAAPTTSANKNFIWSGLFDLANATGSWSNNAMFSSNLFAENATTSGFTSNQVFSSTVDLRNNSDSPLFRQNHIVCSSDVNLNGPNTTFEDNFVSGTSDIDISTTGIGTSNVANNLFNNAVITTDYGYLSMNASFICDGTITSLMPGGPEIPETDAGISVNNTGITGGALIENTHLDQVTITGAVIHSLSQLRTRNASATTVPNKGSILVQYDFIAGDSEALYEGNGTNRRNVQWNDSKVTTGGALYDNNFVGLSVDLSAATNNAAELFIMRNETRVLTQAETDVCENQHHRLQLTP